MAERAAIVVPASSMWAGGGGMLLCEAMALRGSRVRGSICAQGMIESRTLERAADKDST